MKRLVIRGLQLVEYVASAVSKAAWWAQVKLDPTLAEPQTTQTLGDEPLDDEFEVVGMAAAAEQPHDMLTIPTPPPVPTVEPVLEGSYAARFGRNRGITW